MASISPETCADIRRRIIRVYLVQRRWLGFYQVMYYAHFNRRLRRCYPRVVALMAGRGELVMSHDDDNGFWRFLWSGLLRRPAELARACPVEVREREGMRR